MSRIVVALLLLLGAAQTAHAECASTGSRAGCTTANGVVGVGPNGAASYNKNTGQTHSSHPRTAYQTTHVAPGTSAEGERGNHATKAVQQGCAFVNGRRVCQ